MLDKYYENAIDDAINSLKDNGVVIVPTDTVYGLACLASSKEGINRIYEINFWNISEKTNTINAGKAIFLKVFML